MGLACKITGHKWNKLPDGSDGCTCTRCGETREQGHDYRFTVVTSERSWITLKQTRTCMEECSVCGHRRAAEHDWDGCRCTRCDAARDQDHTWGKPYSVSDAHHAVHCMRCTKSEKSPHTFKQLKGGVQKCTECGFELKSKPTFANAVQESDYYAKLIASGEVGFYDHESKKGQWFVNYGDHVTTIPALTGLFIALADNDGAGNVAPKGIVRKLQDIAAEDPGKADDVDAALAQFACDERVHIFWRGWVAGKVKDPDLAKEARESVEQWIEAHPRSQADIDYENAMIASDSGLYTTG